MRNIIIFSGSSHPEFAEAIATRLGVGLGAIRLGKFSNNETRVEILQSVRDSDVYIIQTSTEPVNDGFMELLIMIHACRFASAARITAVIPCFPYARHSLDPFEKPLQDPLSDEQRRLLAEFRNDTHEISGYNIWPVRSGTLIAGLIVEAGADHVITMDLHDPQYQGFFDVPLDNLPSLPLMIKSIRLSIPNVQECVVVSPDAGGAKRAAKVASTLGIDFALIHRDESRCKLGHSDSLTAPLALIGNVSGRSVIMIDDLTDTSDTLVKAATIVSRHGAKLIYAVITHGIFSGQAVTNIRESCIDKVFVSNSVPQPEHVKSCSKFYIYNVAPIFAESIRRHHNGESISYLFKPEAFE